MNLPSETGNGSSYVPTVLMRDLPWVTHKREVTAFSDLWRSQGKEVSLHISSPHTFESQKLLSNTPLLGISLAFYMLSIRPLSL